MRVVTAFTLLLIFTLAGCGGGGGGPAAAVAALPLPPPPPPPPVNQALGGIWEGTDSDGIAVIALTTESGRLHWIADNGEQGFGTGSVKGSAVTFNFTLFTALGFTFPDGSASATCTGSGTIQQRQTLAVTVNCTTTLGTTFSTSASLTYNSLYDRDSALSVIAGNYDDVDLVFNINGNGVIFEQDPVIGCVTNGQITIIDPNFNVYDVSMSIVSCIAPFDVLNGSTFTGLAILDNTAAPEVLFVGITGGVAGVTVAIVFALERI